MSVPAPRPGDDVDRQLNQLQNDTRQLYRLIDQRTLELRVSIEVLGGRLDGRLGVVEAKVDDLSGLEGRFDGLEGRFDGVEDRLGSVEGKVDDLSGLEGRFDGLETVVGRIDARLARMDGAGGD